MVSKVAMVHGIEDELRSKFLGTTSQSNSSHIAEQGQEE